jgi:hypothetical protein
MKFTPTQEFVKRDYSFEPTEQDESESLQEDQKPSGCSHSSGGSQDLQDEEDDFL